MRPVSSTFAPMIRTAPTEGMAGQPNAAQASGGCHLPLDPVDRTNAEPYLGGHLHDAVPFLDSRCARRSSWLSISASSQPGPPGLRAGQTRFTRSRMISRSIH